MVGLRRGDRRSTGDGGGRDLWTAASVRLPHALLEDVYESKSADDTGYDVAPDGRVLFVRDSFGTRHLGALTGLITMVHQIFGGIGAWGGALVFDATGSYDAAFVLMLAASIVALGLTPMLRRPTSSSARSSP